MTKVLLIPVAATVTLVVLGHPCPLTGCRLPRYRFAFGRDAAEAAAWAAGSRRATRRERGAERLPERHRLRLANCPCLVDGLDLDSGGGHPSAARPAPRVRLTAAIARCRGTCIRRTSAKDVLNVSRLARFYNLTVATGDCCSEAWLSGIGPSATGRSRFSGRRPWSAPASVPGGCTGCTPSACARIYRARSAGT